MAQKLDSKTVNERFKTLYNGEYELIDEYTVNNAKYNLKHKKCGTTFIISKLTRFFNETSPCPCPSCREYKTELYDIEKYRTRLNIEYNNNYELISFTKMKEPAILKCKKCNLEFTIGSANSVFLKGRFRGCPNCNPSKRGKHQTVKNYLQSVFDRCDDSSEYKWIDEYKGRNNIKHRILHKKCKNVYEVRPGDFLQGYRCPFCSRKRSSSEKLLFNEILKICPSAINSDRTQINPYELDIFIPDKKIAIEYNGLYWHSEKNVDKNYHRDKMRKCNEKGIRLIQIYEDEWKDKKDIVLSKLKSILNCGFQRKIYARNCICKKITNSKEYMDFLDNNHIQGSVSLHTVYGLYYNDELISVGGFNKLRDSMNSDKNANAWDMLRYASKIDCNVVGGCGKIISTFVKKENCEYIKTLADLRWSDAKSNMYTKLGFSKVSEVPPRYFYTDGISRFSRFNFRKDKIKEKFPEIYNPNLTEFEMMDKTSFNRIWDAGKITYEKRF